MNLDELVATLSPTATTVLIDGRSGAGKTTLTHQLHTRWTPSTVIHLDDIYPGWDGLVWAIRHINSELLTPRAAGKRGWWQRWDWATGTPARWHSVEPEERLIIDGVGTLSHGNHSLADMSIWVQCPDAQRKHRAIRRDGDTYDHHWDRWAAHEDTLFSHFPAQAIADYIATESAGQCWTFIPGEKASPHT